MEGNFETSGGGISGGSSIPDPSGSVEFDSGGNFSDTGDFGSSSSDLTHLDYLKDGVDKGYYREDTEGIFSMEDVMSNAQEEMEQDDAGKDWDMMDIPGTAHEKLSTFAEGEDEIKANEAEIREAEGEQLGSKDGVRGQKETDKSVEPEKKELSFEQQIIKLQAETMKLMAEGMNSKVNKKELEELLKKLQELIKESEKDKDKEGKRATLLTGLFSAVLILIKASEEGYKKLEHEVKEAEK